MLKEEVAVATVEQAIIRNIERLRQLRTEATRAELPSGGVRPTAARSAPPNEEGELGKWASVSSRGHRLLGGR
jgi:hypothetical protein